MPEVIDYKSLAMPDFNAMAFAGATLESNAQIREREWLKQRLGKFTASQFSKLMTYPNKNELPAGAITYIMEKVVEVATDFEPEQGFTSAAIQWGKDHELEAVERFSESLLLNVDFTGDAQQFIDYPLLRAGATPDGLIDSYAGLEVKCPNSATHLSYMAIKNADDLKRIAPNYYWQVMGSLMITGRDQWFFCSYDPRFKDENLQLHTVNIEPVLADIEFLKERLAMAKDYFEQVCNYRGISHAA